MVWVLFSEGRSKNSVHIQKEEQILHLFLYQLLCLQCFCPWFLRIHFTVSELFQIVGFSNPVIEECTTSDQHSSIWSVWLGHNGKCNWVRQTCYCLNCTICNVSLTSGLQELIAWTVPFLNKINFTEVSSCPLIKICFWKHLDLEQLFVQWANITSLFSSIIYEVWIICHLGYSDMNTSARAQMPKSFSKRSLRPITWWGRFWIGRGALSLLKCTEQTWDQRLKEFHVWSSWSAYMQRLITAHLILRKPFCGRWQYANLFNAESISFFHSNYAWKRTKSRYLKRLCLSNWIGWDELNGSPHENRLW